MTEGNCFLCKRWRPLERHHIFGASNRKKSEKYGLTVDLCAECHRTGKKAAHKNFETMQYLHEYGQQLAMEKHNLSAEEFRSIFGMNYI